jgi:tetratricopeptide (TPR) repeat protein
LYDGNFKKKEEKVRYKAQVVFLLVIFLFSSVAVAQPQDEELISLAREYMRQGEVFFNQEHYEDAAEQFKQAWELVGEPAGMIFLDAAAFLFNVGLCYDRAARLDDAIIYYQMYLEKTRQYAAQVDPNDERAILDRIAQFQEQLSTSAETPIIPPGLPNSQAEIFELITTIDTLDRRVTDLENLVLQDESLFFDVIRPSYLFWGAGAIGFIVGGVYGGLALDAESTMRSKQTQVEAWPYKLEAEEDALIANIFYGIGAAALVGGTIWFLVDLFGDDESESRGSTTRTALAPTFTSEHFGLTLSVNF